MFRPVNKRLLNPAWPQWIVAFGATLVAMQIGLLAGWTSPYLVKLTADDSELHITLNEASWVASLPQLGRVFGAILVSMSVYVLGSKTALLITCMPIALCWVFTIVADSVEWLYAARISGGLSFGMCFGSFPLYLGEIADPEIRGALVALASSGIPIGICLGTILGSYLSMSITGWICLVPCLLVLILFATIPESPHHLVRKRNYESAKRSIVWYNRSANADLKVEALVKFVATTDSQSFMEKLREFNVPYIRKATILVIMLFIFMQMCGVNCVLFYMEIILVKGKVVSIDTSLVVIIVNATGIFAGSMTMFFIDKYGRRTVLIISSISATLSLVALGVHFLLLKQNHDPADLEWLPITSLIIFDVAVYVGLIPVPNIVLSELLPPNIKCIASSIVGVIAGLFAFLSSKTYQMLVDLLDDQYVFWLYSVLIILAVPYCLIYMPETKGKTLQEIQDKLMRPSKKSQRDKNVDARIKQPETM